jgi:hypothetical protein
MNSINAINEIILDKPKKKKLLIISLNDILRHSLMQKFSEYYNVTKSKTLESKESSFIFNYDPSSSTDLIPLISRRKSYFNEKKYLVNCKESSGYTNNKINTDSLEKCNGIIFIYSKYSYDSMKHLTDFLSVYHRIIGNKFFPAIFVQVESEISNGNYTSMVTKEEIRSLTMNGLFPLVKIKKEFEKSECDKILNYILSEIKKEKNDEIPYSLVYQENFEINFFIRNHRFFSFLVILCFFLILTFSIIDTIFIINTQDFTNEQKKVDDIFLGIRLNINAINFLSSIIFIKYTLCEREKWIKIRRLDKYVIIVNMISWIIQVILHLRIQHVSFNNIVTET